MTAFGSRWPRAGAAIQAAVVALSTLGLGLYVASEDSYWRNGISRWEAYDAEELTVLAIAAGFVTALALLDAAAHDRRRLGGPGRLASAVAGVLAFLAFLANSLN